MDRMLEYVGNNPVTPGAVAANLLHTAYHSGHSPNNIVPTLLRAVAALITESVWRAHHNLEFRPIRQ